MTLRIWSPRRTDRPRDTELKAKHLVLLSEPFSLSLPYADRQRIVIVPVEQVEAERR
jgi:hypothetical protein